MASVSSPTSGRGGRDVVVVGRVVAATDEVVVGRWVVVVLWVVVVRCVVVVVVGDGVVVASV